MNTRGRRGRYNGFTLVELIIVLTVIIILSLLAIVSYIGITDKARRNSLQFNTQTILRSIKIKKSTDDSFVAGDINEANLAEELGISAEEYSEVSMYYTTDDYIYVVGQKTFSNLIACGTQEHVSVYSEDDAECEKGGSPYEVEDIDDTIGLGGGGTCSGDPYLIESIEDLVTLSNDVNGLNQDGTSKTPVTYSGKCIMLTVDLDFQQSKSYINASRTDFGDINGNGITEGLKKELTTGAGFNPIGDYLTTSRYFAGTLDGNNKYIYNLYINKPTVNYVGLVGYIYNGKINNIYMASINITGNNFTGGLAGRNQEGVILSSSINGNVTGANYVSLCSGYFHANSYSGSDYLANIIVSGNITGVDYVGGLAGRIYGGQGWTTDKMDHVRGLYKNGNILATGSRVGRIVGETATYNTVNIHIGALAVSSVTVNGLTKTSTDQTSIQGSSIDSLSDLYDINIAEVCFDTYIGGDADGDGDYWYADSSGNILRKSVGEYPISFGLSGLGTIESPYLIGSYDDMLEAQIKLNSVYQLTSNIDMSGKPNFMLGSHSNNFTGTLMGNNKTISNYTLNLSKIGYVGLVSENRGTVRNLTLNNADIDGAKYTGLIAGTNSGSISNITSNTLAITGLNYTGGVVGYSSPNASIIEAEFNNSNITGSNYTGGLVGYNTEGIVANSSINGNVTGANYVSLCSGYFHANSYSGSDYLANIIVSGNITGVDYVGGLAGRIYGGQGWTTDKMDHVRGLYKNGNILATGSRVGRIVGETASYNTVNIYVSALVLSSVTINGLTKTSADQTSIQGASINNLSDLYDINIAEAAFDTYIGGDNDADGDYWYADVSGNILRSSVGSYPISFGLSGAGTLVDPYLISSYDDLLEAQINLGSVYQLTSNIDMSGKPNFMLGSHVNNFTGTLLGNNKTISNYTLNLAKIGYVGLVGENKGTVKDLALNNVDIDGANYTGLIGGTNSGTISKITSNTLAVMGSNYTGGIVGYSTGTIRGSVLEELTLNGYNYTGGLAGYTRNTSNNNNIVNGNVTGNNYVGLAVGYDYTSSGNNMTDFVAGGNVTGANYVGGFVGYAYDSHCANEWVNFIKGIYKGGSISSLGSSVGRVVGGLGKYCYNPPGVDASALSTATVNGSTIISLDPTSKNGLDITSGDLSNSATYTARGFNFTDENLDYIWYIDGGVAKFREGAL